MREMALVFDRVHEASETIHEFVTERIVRGVRKLLGRSVDADTPPYLLEEDVEVIKQDKRACVSEQGELLIDGLQQSRGPGWYGILVGWP